MAHLDRAAQQELLDLLAPLLQRAEDRCALLSLALGTTCPVLNRVDCSGAAEPFILRMTDELAAFGEIEADKPALWALLDVVRERVGVDRQTRIDALRPLLSAAPRSPPPLAGARLPSPLHLRVFLASPGDVADERALALKVLEQLQYDPLLRGRITVETVAWDKPGAGAPMLATLTPQAAIAQGLPKPSQCDILIVILWSRIGTPLPAEWQKPDGSPYLSGTEWEYHDALQAAEQNGRPAILVYRRDEEPSFKPSDPHFLEKYQQWQQVEQFFAAFQAPDGSIQRGYNPYDTPATFSRQLDLHLRELIRRRLDSHATPVVTEMARPATPIEKLPLWEGSPFPGLRAFTPQDAPIFFGRGRETDELIRKLADPANRFFAVVGASGSGKSSLVAAGLLPRLQDQAIGVRFTPGGASGNPFRALAEALAATLQDRSADDLELQLCAGSDALAELAGEILKSQPATADWLLFIDQFEELFTLIPEPRRGPFIHWLTTATRTPRLRLVATLRADFYAHCVAYAELAELLRSGSYPLAAPSLGALYEMISGPAERAGLTFEHGLIAQLLADTRTEPGALALLAFALAELYDGRTDDGRLTWAVYEGFHRVQGAIAQRAQAIYRTLASNAQAALGDVFWGLVEVDERGTATRRRAPLRLVTGSDAAKDLVNALTAGRLLVQDSGQDRQPVVEVAHEALLKNWKTLADWIEKASDDKRLLRQFRVAAADWQQHQRANHYLWPEERLRPVRAIVERLPLELDELEQDFLRPEQERLLAELDDPATGHKRRSDIGERLAEIGDPRPGVGVREDGLPDIVWCPVSGGEVTLEGVKGRFTVEPFWIAKYAITCLQYRRFLKAADGYQQDAWWTGLKRAEGAWEQRRKFGNHPADTIDWYQAMAFCRWLSTLSLSTCIGPTLII